MVCRGFCGVRSRVNNPAFFFFFLVFFRLMVFANCFFIGSRTHTQLNDYWKSTQRHEININYIHRTNTPRSGDRLVLTFKSFSRHNRSPTCVHIILSCEVRITWVVYRSSDNKILFTRVIVQFVPTAVFYSLPHYYRG